MKRALEAALALSVALSGLFVPSPALAAPHARILFVVSDVWETGAPPGIYVRRVGSKPQRLTESAYDHMPKWSPDRTKIAFARQIERQGPFGSTFDVTLYAMDEDGSNETQLGLMQHPSDFAWSPDSSRLTFAGDGIRTIRPDGSDETQLTDSGMHPSWSPDGAKVVFSGFASGEGVDIYTVDDDGGEPTRVTTADGDDMLPAWSPDGSQIAFITTRHDDAEEGPFTAEMYVIDPDGANERRLTNDCRFESDILWTDDSRKILYRTHDDIDGCGMPKDDEIRIINVATERSRNITNDKANESVFALSPDGRWLVFDWDDPRANRSQRDLKILRLDGTHGRKLTDTPKLYEMMPDW